MTAKVHFVNENTTLNQALDMMKRQKITRVIVKDMEGEQQHGILFPEHPDPRKRGGAGPDQLRQPPG